MAKDIPLQLKEEKDKLGAIKALGDTKGGKALVSLLVTDIVGGVHKLINDGDAVKEVAEMKARMELAQLIINAEDNEEHLDTLIAEALSE